MTFCQFNTSFVGVGLTPVTWCGEPSSVACLQEGVTRDGYGVNETIQNVWLKTTNMSSNTIYVYKNRFPLQGPVHGFTATDEAACHSVSSVAVFITATTGLNFKPGDWQRTPAVIGEMLQGHPSPMTTGWASVTQVLCSGHGPCTNVRSENVPEKLCLYLLSSCELKQTIWHNFSYAGLFA